VSTTSEKRKGTDMADWYHVQEEPGKLTVQFQQSPNRYWPPAVLKQNPFSVDSLMGRQVELSGLGAVWMCAHVAAVARAAGATNVSVRLAGSEGTSEDLSRCTSLLTLGGPKTWQGALLRVHIPRAPRLSNAAIARLVAPRLQELAYHRPRELILMGRAPLSVYAQAAVVAIDNQVKRITCWSARDGMILVYDEQQQQLGPCTERPDWLAEAVPQPRWPVIIGVVGDPNRGKSVLSCVLDAYVSSKDEESWKLDCDAASPTPDWYLSVAAQPATQEQIQAAEKQRRGVKTPWTSEMVSQVVKYLKYGRELFSVLIADLPGGNHSVKPPDRIPAGREAMFREVDALVLLDDASGSSEQAWRDALAQHDLDRRIAVVLHSDAPKETPSLVIHQQGEVWRGRVTGLDRAHKPERVLERIRPALDALWPHLLGVARRNAGTRV